MMVDASGSNSNAFSATAFIFKSKNSGMHKSYNNLTEIWKEWSEHINKSKRVDIWENLSRLCLPESNKEILSKCNISSTTKEACIEARTGTIKVCSSIKRKDLPISICLEVSIVIKYVKC